MATSQRGRWGEGRSEGEGEGKENGSETPGSLEPKVKTDWEIEDHRKHTVPAGGISTRVGDAPTTCRSRVRDPSKTETNIQLIRVGGSKHTQVRSALTC